MQVCREEENDKVILLKCTSTYPSPYEDMNLETITALQNTFDCIVGTFRSFNGIHSSNNGNCKRRESD